MRWPYPADVNERLVQITASSDHRESSNDDAHFGLETRSLHTLDERVADLTLRNLVHTNALQYSSQVYVIHLLHWHFPSVQFHSAGIIQNILNTCIVPTRLKFV